ncbi:hypothetical protein NEDG_01214 [Nematocida displodere]|uniref:SANT domain-containing protein n=1 Tax=Nematocida displodere TaxID=1805483 RepID=A0A177EAW9_9MICR|nr:hypothetical protein NEDG_01214 [Nematocida displodere]
MVITHSRSQGNACLIRCDGCLMEITSILWLQCSICHIDICPLCFSQKVQISTHTYDHPYRVGRSLPFEADFPGWPMLEEILFVDGLILHGIGNWQEISRAIGRKTEESIQEHFLEVFSLQDSRKLEGLPSETLQSNPLSREISGYMPLRGDFELEYENDAETTVKELSFSKTDTQLEKEMKDALLDSYRLVLLKRRLFRHLVLEQGLLSAKKLMDTEKGLCSGGKSLFLRVKPLLKILSKKEFIQLLSGLFLEMLLRKKIKALHSPRAEGSTRKADLPPAKRQNASFQEDDNPNFHLSANEHSLCKALSVPYHAYTALKETVVLNQLTPENERRPITRTVQGLDEQKLSILIDFFMHNGWIDPGKAAPSLLYPEH